MQNWDDFRFVLTLARRHSLKTAARELGCDQATVGRRIYALEQALGIEVFEKRSDGFFLTTAGQRVLPALETAEASFQGVDRQLAGLDERPAGIVRIALPGALANWEVVPKLQKFRKAFPALELHFLTGAEVVNLARREADVAVRLVKPKQSELIYRRIGELDLAFYASREILRGQPAPKDKADLAKFPFVGLFDQVTSRLEATLLAKVAPYLHYVIRSAAWSSVTAGVRAGLGVGILPGFIGGKVPELQRLEAFGSAKTPLWLVTHPDIQNSVRVRAVIDFFAELFR